MCRRRLFLSAAAALLLAPTVLATPASSSPHPETTPATSIPSTAPKLELLRVQSHKLAQPVYAESAARSTQIQNCDGVRCLWDYLSQKVRNAAERLGGDVEELTDFIAYSHDDTLPIPKDDDDDVEWADVWDDQAMDTKEIPDLAGLQAPVDEPETSDGTSQLEHVDDSSSPSYPRQPPLLMTVALVAIAIGYFSLWGIHHLHRRTARLCLQHQPLPTVSDEHRRRHGDPRSARRVRRKVQQREITRCVRGVLRRWAHGNAGASEGKRAVGGRPMTAAEGEASTMEGEISRLREVAEFIDNVVAAEQGMARSGRSDALSASRPRIPDRRSDSSFSEQAFADGDVCLPSYDTVTEDPSLVADGLRHAPDSSMRSRDHGEGNDVSKYTKK
ncbi:hypothetical protein HRG_004966 [Hirsutella rhossiliensis]|uniref:Uncharacterized protein n=1 Tax=Hirsutella rhossiliensis TaxID=111463 RepID=A0A9P8MY91_9HYPO|nr:uncharacterized protein HRG_04966 [Hirsutella rhossiliensis]KAH0964538.1 hypothetical protein HRG_04966 [Hirsutella rhossiliensis]